MSDLLSPPGSLPKGIIHRLQSRGHQPSYKVESLLVSHQPVPKVWKWLDRHNLSDYVARVTNRKVPAVVYLDDRAIRFDGDFEEVLEEIKHFRPHWKR